MRVNLFQKLTFLNILNEFILHMHIKSMSQRKIIRTDVNLGDFLKSILHVGDITRQFEFGDSRQILGNWN